MVSKSYAAALFLAGSCLAQSSATSSAATSTPTCGLVGYDSGSGNLGYYGDSAVAIYSSYSACNALCTSNSGCLSFGYDPGVACILYATTAETNVISSAGSPWTFLDRGGVCPTVATSSTTSAGPTATPTCTGLVGYDAGGTNIGFYADAASATYSGCLALCNANTACLSFGLTSSPACILYNYTVEGNDIASPGSGNTFYDRGGACPSTTSATSTTVTTPVQTGAFANCPSNLVPFNVNTGATPYSPCNSSYPYSACMSDVDKTSTYCNLCLSCTNTTCTSDSDCGTGYACISNSSCTVTGASTGAPVCLYMLAGGSTFGCYGSAGN